MCGIAGYFGKGNIEVIRAMAGSLKHRGPDNSGFYVDKNIGLGHRRLSIMDLSPKGNQPMFTENKNVAVILNGEIYNFKDLKVKLKKHSFSSKTDTEVIGHLYEEVGEKVFEYLDGMFAIAIFDKQKQTLLLARDRMGKKPLYYFVSGNTFIFASELRALMKHPEFMKELDISAINKYLLYEYIPTPGTIFKNTFKLEPGSFIKIDKDKKIAKEFFWNLEFNIDKSVGKEEAAKNIDKLLDASVSKRLMSDVPLGVLLSGGLDSSAIAYYAQKQSMNKINTFSISFEEKTFDESQYAKQVSDFLGTNHFEQRLDARMLIELLPGIVDTLDEPMADPSLVPTYLLMKETKKHITVALSGDGSDELFCGYDPFVAHKLAHLYEIIPKFFRKNVLERAINNLPTSFSNISLDFKLKSFVKGFSVNKKYRDSNWMGSFTDIERGHLFKNEIWDELGNDNVYAPVDEYLDKFDASFMCKDDCTKEEKHLSSLIYLYLKMYMMDGILVKVDRTSMQHALEVRSPFLDKELVEYTGTLGVNLKLNGIKTKYILKETMRDKLPTNIINRKKKGFGMPIAEWLHGPLKNYARDLLSYDNVLGQGIFDYKYIEKLLSDHFNKKADNRKKIWTLLVFSNWYNNWYK